MPVHRDLPLCPQPRFSVQIGGTDFIVSRDPCLALASKPFPGYLGLEAAPVLCSLLLPSHLPPMPSSLSPGKRTKKGMATAKQRLGKILKIHRNGKLLL